MQQAEVRVPFRTLGVAQSGWLRIQAALAEIRYTRTREALEYMARDRSSILPMGPSGRHEGLTPRGECDLLQGSRIDHKQR